MSPAHRILAIGSVVALAILPLSACGGGGSRNAQSTIPLAQAGASPVAGADASGTIVIKVPMSATSASRTLRHTAYVSVGTTRAAVFIDGSTTPAGSTTSCTSSTCTIAWSAGVSVPGNHNFAIETDNGTKVLSEGIQSYPIVSGNNGTLATITLNGVAALAANLAERCGNASCAGQLTIYDAAGDAIVNTTSPLATGFDNGPLTYSSTAAGVGTVTSGATLTQPTAAGTAPYAMTCATSASSFATTLSPASTTGSGDITTAELTNRGVTYPASITYGSNTYTCTTSTTIWDGPGRIYVGQFAASSSASVYAGTASGAAATVATIGGGSTGVNYPLGFTYDASGRVYIANWNASTVLVYPANPTGTVQTAPIATIGGSNTLLSSPVGLAFDGSGRLYVADNGNNTVTVYAANSFPSGTLNEAPLVTIGGAATGLSGPQGLAIDASGRIYVDSGSTIEVFAPYPSGGNEAPLATISGAATGLNGPVGLALDSTGRIYASNSGASTVTIYAAYPASGNEAPLATISGAATGLYDGFGVALDQSGRIYVANGNATVTVYAAYPAAGNEAPLQTITGAPTPTDGIGFH